MDIYRSFDFDKKLDKYFRDWWNIQRIISPINSKNRRE